MNNNAFSWPPPYIIKKHPRVRHIKLKASVKNGLEIIVPNRFNIKHVDEILETNKPWIIKNLENIREKFLAMQAQALPEEIIFHALNETWRVFYIQSENKKLKIHLRPQQELVLLGDTSNKEECKKLLTKWARRVASRHILNRLKHVSTTIQLPYSEASIRAQRSRWGSCSIDKAINLNYKLIFLPLHLMDHIIIHELCHTVHLNHSTKFWRKVASFDPSWKENVKEMRLADKFVPTWVE